MKGVLVGLVILLTLPAALAEQSAISLLFKDAGTDKAIVDLPLMLTATNTHTNEALRFARFLDQEGHAEIELSPGTWRLSAKADLPKTPGHDYFGEQSVTVEHSGTEKILLFPGGTLRGTVVDRLDNVVSHAELKFDCPSANINYPASADKFGMFTIDWLPTGICTISAKYKNSIGSQTINISQGDAADMEIKLDKNMAGSSNKALLILLAMASVAIAVLIIYKKAKKKTAETTSESEKKETAVKETKKEPEVSRRAADIMQTLNAKEKKVVDFLLQNPETSQAKIYNRTAIPKTSLSRILQSLTYKKVIEVEKIGKLKKVKLTDWFIGKE